MPIDCVEYRLPSGQSAIFDASDEDLISRFSWYMNPQGYAIAATKPGKSGEKRKTITMHGLVMMRPVGCIIDHINGNKLDNRKDNLRYCSYSENSMNAKKKSRYGIPTSQHKGVSWHVRGHWQIVVRIAGKITYIGKYDTEQEAAIAAAPYFQTHFHRVGVSS